MKTLFSAAPTNLIALKGTPVYVCVLMIAIWLPALTPKQWVYTYLNSLVILQQCCCLIRKVSWESFWYFYFSYHQCHAPPPKAVGICTFPPYTLSSLASFFLHLKVECGKKRDGNFGFWSGWKCVRVTSFGERGNGYTYHYEWWALVQFKHY